MSAEIQPDSAGLKNNTRRDCVAAAVMYHASMTSCTRWARVSDARNVGRLRLFAGRRSVRRFSLRGD
jgi:hypothetical protein